MDTGLLTTHSEFDGRLVKCGFDAYSPVNEDGAGDTIPNDNDRTGNGTRKVLRCVDGVNHGTHVAGTVGGQISGVAKNATLVSVTVFTTDGRATRGSIYAGLNYVMGQRKAQPKTPMVLNISIGSYFSKSFNRLLDQLVDAGVVVVVSAGNRGLNACLFSPASAKRPITVGATAYSRLFGKDRRAFYSNHGRCVDIFAYVSCILRYKKSCMSSLRLIEPHLVLVHSVQEIELLAQVQKARQHFI
jgi:subtilisin family serine protease